jgi:hypothetical protein
MPSALSTDGEEPVDRRRADWTELGNAAPQLALNLLCIVTAVAPTLLLQRVFYRRRRPAQSQL